MIYKGFASVYDYLMKDTPYDSWFVILKEVLSKYDFTGKSILDLACGTGEMTNRLSKDGFKVMGVDLSPEMLEIAQEKAYNQNLKVNYINQNITKLELFHTYDGIISFCDGFNYITDESDLLETFKHVYKYLNATGLFIFDISSAYKLEHILGENVFTETSEHTAYIWENYYDRDEKLLEFDLTIFKEQNGHYERSDEVHIQRAYDIEEIKNLLLKSGFTFEEVLDTNTGKAVTETTERWLFVGRK